MRFKILTCFIIFVSNLLSATAMYVNITGCPSLYLFVPNVKRNETLPPCFCDNATAIDDPPVAVNCFTGSTFADLTQALTNVQKSGKKLATVNVEYMTFDDHVGIPDHYFQKFGFAPTEITIVGCQNDLLSMNYTFSGLEKSLKKLLISGCNIPTVPRSMANLASLEWLALQDTYIYTIYKNDFRGLKALKHLDLVGNQIIHVEDGAFDDLYNVEEAILGPRNSMNESAFGELNKLKSARKLVLYNNYLQELPDHALSNLSNLQELDLSTNYIENITLNSFAGLTNLTKLTLRQNILKRIDDGSFHSLTNLRYLDLQANFLEDIWPETFQGLGLLETLDLDWNNFYVIDRGTFAATPRLKTLKLCKNTNLLYVDPAALEDLQDLRMLNLSQSNLTTIPTDLLKPVGMQLEILDVSGSTLNYLDPETFHYGAYIQNLSMADTQLVTVPNGVFAYLTHAKYLDLSNNKWICDDQLAWLVQWLKDKTSKANLTLVSPDRTTCWEPLELRSQTLVSLDPNTLKPYTAPKQIEQPPTTSTKAWYTETTRGSNDTNNTSSDLLAIISSSSTTTTKAPGSSDLAAVKDQPSSTKIKIVIAVVASVVAVATIAVIAIVVVIMRRRKRKQQIHDGSPKPPHPTRQKPTEETEMAMTHPYETNGSAKNGYASQELRAPGQNGQRYDRGAEQSSRHQSADQSNDPV